MKAKAIGRPANPGRVAPQLHINVTKEDINKGCLKNAATCMIAQAVMRSFPGAQFLRIDAREIAFSDPQTQTRRRYFNTAKGAKAVLKFDKGDRDIRPFGLHLNDGIVVPMGWRAKHPGSTRKGKIYRRTGKKGVRYTKFRHFGACNIQVPESEGI